MKTSCGLDYDFVKCNAQLCCPRKITGHISCLKPQPWFHGSSLLWEGEWGKREGICTSCIFSTDYNPLCTGLTLGRESQAHSSPLHYHSFPTYMGGKALRRPTLLSNIQLTHAVDWQGHLTPPSRKSDNLTCVIWCVSLDITEVITMTNKSKGDCVLS